MKIPRSSSTHPLPRSATAVTAAVLLLLSILTASPATADSDAIGRLAGATRYETAVAVSQHGFPTGATSVVVANSGVFADALSAAPLARVKNGPVLLTSSATLNSATRDEIVRLSPQVVYVVGGTGAVSATVQSQIQNAAGSATKIVRLGGASRYDTSAKISNAAFAPNVDYAFVASGRNFPDALSAAASAGSRGGPVLLSLPDTLPSAINTELNRLNPKTIILVGGVGAMSPALEKQLSSFGSKVVRIGGADRFETSRLLSERLPQTGTSVYLANGYDFPDALSAGPVAAMNDATVLITPANVLHTASASAITRLRPENVYLVGGAGVLTAGVQSGVQTAFTGYFQNCAEMRDAGMAPRYSGQPGYSKNLDRDEDGIACDIKG